MKFRRIATLEFLVGIMLTVSLLALSACNQKKLTKSKTSQIKTVQIVEKVYEQVEQMPEFPGGELELRKFLATNVRYPAEAHTNKIQGKVFVSFVVGKDGAVKNVKIARGADPLLDAESLRVVSSMPKWTPGKEKGKVVAVQYTVPIAFVLQ